jgi:hypothetical protein
LLSLRCLWRIKGKKRVLGLELREQSEVEIRFVSHPVCETVVSIMTAEYLSDVRSRNIFRTINVTVMCLMEEKSDWQC